MYYTGFADEAADGIDGQIRATLELGWNRIESRHVNGVNIHDLPEEEFQQVIRALEASPVRINCFGSAVANWKTSVLDPFDETITLVKRTIERMTRLDCRMIRIMSFGILSDRSSDDQCEQERFRRVREIKRMFEGAGILPVHENCMNYGGMSPVHMQRLIDNVPGLKIVFDTGNPPFTYDYSRPRPYPKQSSWDFYQAVREHIAYIHIKDGIYVREKENSIFPECRFTMPDEGHGDVRRILSDLMQRGYDGGISIEPHLSKVFHEDRDRKSPEQVMYERYVAYGRKVMAIVEDIKTECSSSSCRLERIS